MNSFGQKRMPLFEVFNFFLYSTKQCLDFSTFGHLSWGFIIRNSKKSLAKHYIRNQILRFFVYFFRSPRCFSCSLVKILTLRPENFLINESSPAQRKMGLRELFFKISLLAMTVNQKLWFHFSLCGAESALQTPQQWLGSLKMKFVFKFNCMDYI